jgi:hypothetical protein
MLNIHDTAKQAASEFGLSMKDDPTLWPAGDEITAEQVRKACNATALENARSALSRALGKIAETVATDMDVALAEDGPLADLDAVLAQHVEDGPEIDLSGVAGAADWQARVEAMREAFAVAVQGYHVPPLPVIDIMHYVGSDPRLDGEVMRVVATLRGPEHEKPDAPAALMVNGGGDEWDEPDTEVKDEADAADPWAEEDAAPKQGDYVTATVQGGKLANVQVVDPPAPVARERGKPAPGRKRRTKAEIAEDEAADALEALGTAKPEYVQGPDSSAAGDWDEEPAAPELDAGWDDAAPAATAPNLPGLTSAAGIADTDMATILGIAKGYYSLIRNGKRPWPGLKPDQVQRLKTELAARREAIAAVEAALSTDAVLKPEGV